jgi:hypothetical protein
MLRASERQERRRDDRVPALSTGVTFALTEKAPVDKIPLITAGYGRSESQNGAVFTWNFRCSGPTGLAPTSPSSTSPRRKAASTS